MVTTSQNDSIYKIVYKKKYRPLNKLSALIDSIWNSIKAKIQLTRITIHFHVQYSYILEIGICVSMKLDTIEAIEKVSIRFGWAIFFLYIAFEICDNSLCSQVCLCSR